LDLRVASIEDPASLDRALDGAEVVINCAGPFGETAPAVIEAALRARCHYLDVTGEALVTIETFARYADSELDASACEMRTLFWCRRWHSSAPWAT
jgi:short subunit dehydrogenase-like uncharacterized protein